MIAKKLVRPSKLLRLILNSNKIPNRVFRQMTVKF